KRNPDGQGFAAFGKVIEGMDLVKQIQNMPDVEQMLENPVYINKIEIISD
ncbi:MAG TPA: peptidylprolyl isomerase, partial [Bacteroidales bacterium]|nr:peptidylprolyl isomerase [Bacteroidales bacterium]